MPRLDPRVVQGFKQMRARYINPRSMRIGRYDSSGQLEADPTADLPAGYVWIHDRDNPRATVSVLNLRVENAAGLPVIVETNTATGEDEITGVDPITAPVLYGSSTPGMNSPRKGAAIPTPVSARDVIPGGLYGDADAGGLYVRIGAFWHRGGFWDGNTTILLTPTATAGSKSYAVVGIDPATNAAVSYLTTDRAAGMSLITADQKPLLPEDIQAVIDAHPLIQWSGAAELANGDTGVNGAKIVDLRFWQSPPNHLNIDAFDAIATVASAADYVIGYDTSAETFGKILVDDLPGGGGSSAGMDDMTLLVSNEVGTAASSVTLTIPGTHKHLLVMVKTKSTRTDDTDTLLKIQFNSDTGSNYAYVYDLRRVTSASVTESTSAAYVGVGVIGSQSTPVNQANFWTTALLRINNYANTDNYKLVDWHGDWFRSTSSIAMTRITGVWKNTAAITSIDLSMVVGDIAAGSTFYVYGLGEAILRYSDANVSNPPTLAEIEAAFDTAANAGAGFVGVLDDAGAGTNVYGVFSTGATWFYATLTEAT